MTHANLYDAAAARMPPRKQGAREAYWEAVRLTQRHPDAMPEAYDPVRDENQGQGLVVAVLFYGAVMLGLAVILWSVWNLGEPFLQPHLEAIAAEAVERARY